MVDANSTYSHGDPPDPLPEVLPVFPLTGVLLLPGSRLPLHVFEERYRNMVADALEAEGVFGMIQPVAPQEDNRPAPGIEETRPELYGVGCAGWIERYERTPDGRYVLTLLGVGRFRVVEELPDLHRGYRRVRADYAAFPDRGPQPPPALDRTGLVGAIDRWLRAHGQALDPKRVEDLDDVSLLHAVVTAMPFHPSEKQALLEAPTLTDRERLLHELMGMSEGTDVPDSPPN